jgi:hypothetical protein
LSSTKVLNVSKRVTFFGGMGIFEMLIAAMTAFSLLKEQIAGGDIEPDTLLFVLSTSLIILGLLFHAINWRFKEVHNVMIRHYDQLVQRRQWLSGFPVFWPPCFLWLSIRLARQ